MSTCGLLAKIALTATLLGNQELKIETMDQSSVIKHCTATEPENSNATVVLKDALGREVFVSQIRVGQFDFYESPTKRGGVPAKKATFLFSYPVNEKTSAATTIELKLKGRAYSQVAQLQNLSMGPK
ncbi:MAG: hypothetical protein V4692_09900 [Bdellovibrionota bacterium]